MGEKRVVFVIGAGASVDFGLPTGSTLRELLTTSVYPRFDIKALRSLSAPAKAAFTGTSSDSSAFGLLLKAREEIKLFKQRSIVEAEAFRVAFLRSGMSSIDRFLESNSNWVEHGKCAIASVLVPLQDKQLEAKTTASNWHSWLFERLLRQRAAINEGRIGFITFNYDRLVHCGLYSMLRHGLQQSDDGTRATMAKIPIEHVYGYLDVDCDSLLENGDIERNDDEIFINERYQRAAQSIHLIPETRVSGTDVYTRCQSMINKASVVVFLGFGFDRVNLERIGALEIARSKRVYANCFGLEAAERRLVGQLLTNSSALSLGDSNHDSLRFMKANLADWIESI